MAKNDLHSVEFFDLQLRFAEKVAELSGTSLAEAVGTHTNIYVRLGMGQRLDVTHPDWQAYVSGLARASSKAKWTHAVHRRRIHLPAGPTPAKTVGCFSYAWAGDDCVRLHFHADNERAESPLSAANQRVRRKELASLLSDLKGSLGDNVSVIGASWLYNLHSYRCLFPEHYLASLRAVEHPYQRMPLWGQFLNRDRSVRVGAATRFLARITQASSLAQLESCFPFVVLATRSPARWLCEHTGL
jgi:hypothetical protein